MKPAIRKLLYSVLVMVLFPLSCGALVPVWQAYEMKKNIRPVEGEARKDFPVALFRTEASGEHRVQLVFYGDLQEEMKKNKADYLAPRSQVKELQAQLKRKTSLETGNSNDPWEVSFTVEEDHDGKQVLRVSYAVDDDDVNTGWYEASASGIRPLRHQRAFGPALAMNVMAKAFGTTAVLWAVLFIIARTIRKRTSGHGSGMAVT